MINPLARTKYGPLGIDVGTDGVRVIQFRKDDETYAVHAAERGQFPQPVADDAGQRRKQAVGVLGELLARGNFQGRRCVSCIPHRDLAIKNVRLPRMSEKDLAGAVLWEAGERFGFDVTPDRLHFINAGEVRHGTEVRDEVLLIAVKEETVRQHLEMLSELRLFPTHIDSEPTALFRAYHRFLRRAEDKAAPSVIVDIGKSGTKVVIARGCTILLIKDIPIAGDHLNDSVAKELGLSQTEARHLRKQSTAAGEQAAPERAGDFPDRVRWSVLDAIRGQVEELCREISLCLRYCSVTFRGLRPTQATVTGGEANDASLLKLMNDHLECRCQVGQPLYGVILGQGNMGSDRRGTLTEWSVAAGLALRGLMIEQVSSGKAPYERRRLSA